jgi:phosphoglycolate phosphatase
MKDVAKLDARVALLIDNVSLVAIDLDGTMVDTCPDLATAVNAMLASLDLPPLPDQRLAEFVGNGVEMLVLRSLEESGRAVASPEVALLVNRFTQLYSNALYNRSRLYPGAVDGLNLLLEAGLPVCCVTNKATQFTVPLLKAAGLDRFLHGVYCADEPGQRKPSPSLLQQAARDFSVPVNQILMVGDSGNDVLAARAAGCRVAAVNYGYNHGRPVAEHHPDWIISSLAELGILTIDTEGDRDRAATSRQEKCLPNTRL